MSATDISKSMALGMPAALAKHVDDTYGDVTNTETIAGNKTFSGDNTHSGTSTFSGTLNASGPLQIGGVAVTSSAAELNIMDGVLATAAEINRAVDVSTRIVNATGPTLVVTEEDHDGKTIVLDRAAGIAVTLPAASAGLRFRFIVKTTFTGAASIKSVSGADIMIGYALMSNDSDNSVVRWPVVAADTADTIDLLGTSNSTGGLAGQEITIEGLAANLWFVKIVGDAAGTEATPFTNTVA